MQVLCWTQRVYQIADDNGDVVMAVATPTSPNGERFLRIVDNEASKLVQARVGHKPMAVALSRVYRDAGRFVHQVHQIGDIIPAGVLPSNDEYRDGAEVYRSHLLLKGLYDDCPCTFHAPTLPPMVSRIGGKPVDA